MAGLRHGPNRHRPARYNAFEKDLKRENKKLETDLEAVQNTKEEIVKLISELEDAVANNEDCHKIVTKLKYAANRS